MLESKEMIFHVDMNVVVDDSTYIEKKNKFPFLQYPDRDYTIGYTGSFRPTTRLPGVMVRWYPDVKGYIKDGSRINTWDGTFILEFVPVLDETFGSLEFTFPAFEE